ncbi:MAG: PLDc_N domain-containing protein [Leptolyngbya sp. SIO1E4]|nr:PLDc_N domain-containing protein [Leptolyngbya sp. SIO1E4]
MNLKQKSRVYLLVRWRCTRKPVLTASLILVIPAAIVVVGSILWMLMLMDCAMQEPSQGNTKIVWVLIIIFTTWVGALAYLLFRRPERQRELGR